MIQLSTLTDLFEHQVPRRILDIGTQNMLRASEEAFRKFLDQYGNDKDHQAAAADFAHRSIIRPGEVTLYLSEVLEETLIGYVSFDVCPGHKTEIFDLNTQILPSHYKGKFDLILNCGTSEHILNQVNVMKVIHDAARVGAYIYHQVPTTGRIDHGYFCYHPRLFRDLAEANGYEIADICYMRSYKRDPDSGVLVPRFSSMAETGIKFRGKKDKPLDIPMHSICVLFRKVEDDVFRLPLEVATRHAEPDENMAASYGWTRSGIDRSAQSAGLLKKFWQWQRRLFGLRMEGTP